jgi:hypothetical protein
VELLKSNGEGSESILKTLWHHSDAIMCCSLKVCMTTIYPAFHLPLMIEYLDKDLGIMGTYTNMVLN